MIWQSVAKQQPRKKTHGFLKSKREDTSTALDLFFTRTS